IYDINDNYENYYSNDFNFEFDKSLETSPEILHSSEITKPNVQTILLEKEK
ncbi:30262_t:CDS:1, partial [Gigaspora margarita]